MEIEKILQSGQFTIVDVRSIEEYSTGHVEGSINIPLHELEERASELSTLRAPFIFCCASGMRSERATQFIHNSGLECFNGGSWHSVKSKI